MGLSHILTAVMALSATALGAPLLPNFAFAQPGLPGLGGPEELPARADHQSEVELIEAPGARASGEGLEEQSAEPRYVLESVVVQGNRKTRQAVILRELGLKAGDVVTPDDRRVASARLRLLSLGYFLDVRLSLAKGKRRGSAILQVEVEERGTITLNGLFLGTSEATALWGGLDIAETNLFGRGILLAAAFVHSTQPTVPGAEAGQAYRLQLGAPVPHRDGAWFSGSVLYNRGSEFFRAFGDSGQVDPQHHVAVNARRLGGRGGVGFALSRNTRLTAEGRLESVRASLPDIRSRDLGGGRTDRIDFSVNEGDSRVASVILNLDVDTRDDPFLPRAGQRFVFTVESALAALASDYSFMKGVLQYAHHTPMSKGRHSLTFHALGGVIQGYAPYFDRFFVADLNVLLPSRVLGLNFSTLPSRNFLNTSVTEHRFNDYAARIGVEYAIGLWRGRGFLYRADGFTGFGVFGITGAESLRLRQQSVYRTIPIDVTADLGIRLDTVIGIFNISIANALGRIPY